MDFEIYKTSAFIEKKEFELKEMFMLFVKYCGAF